MGILDRVRQYLPTAPAPVADAVIDDPTKLTRGSRAAATDLYYSTQAIINAVTGVGTSRDPSSANTWAKPRPLHQGEQFGMGRNALIGQALGKLPNTATREGWRVEITDDRVEDKQAVADKIAAYETKLGIGNCTARALVRTRQYSQALVWLGIEDGRDFSQPVDWDNVKRIRWAVVVDRRDFRTHSIYQADSNDFSRVETFQIIDVNGVLEDGLRYDSGTTLNHYAMQEALGSRTGSLVVHADRVLHFATVDFLPMLDGLQDSLGGFFTAMSGISTAARTASTVVYKVKDWVRKAWSDNAALAHAHMSFLDKAVSVMNAWIIDKDQEDVEIKNRSLGGVSQLADPFMVWLAAALAIPVTVLWGVSPGGFGKGDAEERTWHAEVRAYQANVLAPRLKHLHALVLVAEDGCKLPKDVERSIAFTDLSPPDEETRGKLRNDALSELRQLVKDELISREEARPAIVALVDDYFRPELDLETAEDAKLAPVGVFTAAIALQQALYPTGVPVEAGRNLMLALASTYFTAENVANVFPDRPEAATPIAGAVPGTGGNPGDPNAEVEDEPNEVDVAWSKTPPPPDAVEAPAIAAELNIPTLRVTRAHKAGLIQGWNVLGGKPRYSVSEVKRAVLESNGKLPAATTSAADASDEPCSCGIMLRAPKHVAQWVPHKSEDPSAPHVTLLYIGKLAPHQLLNVIDVVRLAVQDWTPIEVSFNGVDYFDNDKRVAFAKIVPTPALVDFHGKLRAALSLLGINAKHHAGEYTPHMTLAYLDPGEDYTGPCPSEGWTATGVEVWYDDVALPIAFPERDPQAIEDSARDTDPVA